LENFHLSLTGERQARVYDSSFNIKDEKGNTVRVVICLSDTAQQTLSSRINSNQQATGITHYPGGATIGRSKTKGITGKLAVTLN
jgi:hypothetical protein